jgi:hypothetical protein
MGGSPAESTPGARRGGDPQPAFDLLLHGPLDLGLRNSGALRRLEGMVAAIEERRRAVPPL